MGNNPMTAGVHAGQWATAPPKSQCVPDEQPDEQSDVDYRATMTLHDIGNTQSIYSTS